MNFNWLIPKTEWFFRPQPSSFAAPSQEEEGGEALPPTEHNAAAEVRVRSAQRKTSSKPRIILSTRAYADLLNETSQHLQTETGGVFIGACEDGIWYVVESIDPGPRALLSHSYFEYDQAYVNHLANKVSKRYSSPLRLLGLWHRHPGSFDSFSSTDDQTHLRYLQQCGEPIVSVLVNIDPQLRLTPYVIDGPPVRHHPVSYAVGDDLLPAALLAPLDHNALLRRIHSPSARVATSSVLQIVDRERNTDARPLTAMAQHRSETTAATPEAEDVLAMLDSEMECNACQRSVPKSPCNSFSPHARRSGW
jgi:integrative and conjugative element protein (TIGR02256 family)